MALPRHKSFEKTHAIWLPMRPHDFPKTQLFFNTHAIKLDSTRKRTFCCCVRMDLKCYICVVYVQQERTKNENARSAGTRVLWARWQFGAERLWIYQHTHTPYPAAQRAMAVSDPSFSPKGVLPSP